MPDLIADAELVARSRGRDAEAFGVLVERHQQLVFGVALARCHDPALAEDLAQEAFVAAWRDLDRLRDVDRVGSWVAGIARNLASNAVRARGRRQEPEPPHTEVPTPHDEALVREDRELLGRALADVPEAHRETLVLFYLEGESISDIATALGIREDLVKQRLSRGRKALRESVATRVESALTRARLRPAFRVGVVAALSLAGTRKAAAASSAGKVIAVMSAHKLVIASVAVLVIAGGAIWIAHARSSSPSATAGSSAELAKSSGSPSAGSQAPSVAKPRVERLADARARTVLLDAIRQTHERRAAALAQSTTPGGTTPAPALPESEIDKKYIRAAVREMIPLLSECYEAGLERDPKLAGKIVVKFTIEGEQDVGGVVGESKVDPDESTLADPAVQECIQETMYALKIDPPPNGGVVRVHYPFLFAPAPPPEPPR
jgi:RNA polymerase sigma factor (sigma-70 family)